jgi:hypothetical protein
MSERRVIPMSIPISRRAVSIKALCRLYAGAFKALASKAVKAVKALLRGY